MSGSMDDREVHVVNATQETVLTVLVYPDGKSVVLSNQSKEWVADVLRRLANTQAPADPSLTRTPMDTNVPSELIEMVREQVDGMISDLASVPPVTTAQMIYTFGQQLNLTDEQHRRMLATTAAILMQRVVYA
jgi:hypothetical protein